MWTLPRLVCPLDPSKEVLGKKIDVSVDAETFQNGKPGEEKQLTEIHFDCLLTDVRNNYQKSSLCGRGKACDYQVVTWPSQKRTRT